MNEVTDAIEVTKVVMVSPGEDVRRSDSAHHLVKTQVDRYEVPKSFPLTWSQDGQLSASVYAGETKLATFDLSSVEQRLGLSQWKQDERVMFYSGPGETTFVICDIAEEDVNAISGLLAATATTAFPCY